MTRRNKTILLTILIIILIAFIVLVVWIVRRDAKPRSSQRNATTERSTTVPAVPTAILPTTIEPAPTGPIAQNPRVVALDFTERYGSYSSQGDYQNLRDLFPQMTTRMRETALTLIESTPLDSSTYSGFTTRALRADGRDSNASSLIFSVEAQRIETSPDYPQGRAFYQTAELVLVKSDLKWLVDSFEWK